MSTRVKALNQLLKIVKKRMDERKCSVSFIRSKIEQYEETLSKMEEEMAREYPMSELDAPCIQHFASYHQYFIKKRGYIKDEIVKLCAELECELKLLHEAFLEQKRYEYLLNKLDIESKNIQRKIERAEMDEIGRTISMRNFSAYSRVTQ